MKELEILQRRFDRERKARKEAEHLLEEKSRELFLASQRISEVALFAELSPDPLMRVDGKGTLILANPAAKQLLGDKINIGKSIPEALTCLKGIDFEQLIVSNQFLELQTRVDKQYFRFVLKGIEKYGYVNLYGSDITQRELAKQGIQKAHQETEALLASISSILIGLDERGRITRWNSTAEASFGYKTSQVLGTPLITYRALWNIDDFASLLDQCVSQDYVHLNELKYSKPDGNEGYLNVHITSVRNEREEHTGYLILATDITQQKLLESQLLQAQKLESLGQLAAGIAHEINTPIQFIGDNTRFLEIAFQKLDRVFDKSKHLLNQFNEGNPLDELIGEIEQLIAASKLDFMREEIPFAIEESLGGVDHVATIVKAMKQFSHPGKKDKSPTNINEAIQSTINVARNEWKYVAKLVCDLDQSLPLVPCLHSELNQVILNMIINAAHAIVEKNKGKESTLGKITIATRRANGWVEISISDTGTGISDDIKNKIFDPFFTTKEIGKGTGQGLSLAFNVIVEKHGGLIDLKTALGEGSTFTIRIPINLPEPEASM